MQVISQGCQLWRLWRSKQGGTAGTLSTVLESFWHFRHPSDLTWSKWPKICLGWLLGRKVRCASNLIVMINLRSIAVPRSSASWTFSLSFSSSDFASSAGFGASLLSWLFASWKLNQGRKSTHINEASGSVGLLFLWLFSWDCCSALVWWWLLLSFF